jgi:hypothetical protein
MDSYTKRFEDWMNPASETTPWKPWDFVTWGFFVGIF